MALLARIVAQTGAVLNFKNPNLFIVVPPGCVGNLLCRTLVMIELETNDVLSLPKSRVLVSRKGIWRWTVVSELRFCPIIANVQAIPAAPVNTAVSTNAVLPMITNSLLIPKVLAIPNSRLEQLFRLSIEIFLEKIGLQVRQLWRTWYNSSSDSYIFYILIIYRDVQFINELFNDFSGFSANGAVIIVIIPPIRQFQLLKIAWITGLSGTNVSLKSKFFRIFIRFRTDR